ncbi:MAG: ISLre2 family transposase, partial [Fusobacteriaceae bacterium]|nr:ISLre2 family transposase [Fusobacteriaceae bacterium]
MNNTLDSVCEAVTNVYEQFLEQIDRSIESDPDRKKKYYLIRKGCERTMMFKIGNLHIKRAYYQDKVTGEYLFLLDKLLNLPKYERLSNTCIKSVIEEATDSSYKKAGEKASISAGVSKQTVKNFMHKVKVPQEIVELKKKKEARILHIVADEDHVSLQRYGKNRQKIAMPKLIMLYEGVVPDAGEGMSSKRNKVIEKFYFSGLYKGKNSHKIWERVAEYIEKTYDYEKIEKIYINGDGAAWIKAGCDFIEKSVFVLDKYHMKSAINDCVAGLEEKIQRDIKDRLYRSLRELDKREFFRLLEMSKDFLEGQKKKAAVEEKIKYLRYHWRAIEIQITDAKYLTGCCAEGQVSHVLSSRLSSRPLGWSLV